MKESLYNRAIVVEALPLSTIDDNATTAGTVIDLNLFNNKFRDSVLFQIITGVVTDGTYVVGVEESENGTDYVAVPADRIQGSKPTLVAASDASVFQFGVAPGKGRWLRLSVESSGTTTGAVLAATAVLYGASKLPVKRS